MGNWVTISQAGSSGYTPPPDAPNLTSVTASAYYGLVGNGSAYGLQGTIDLPTGATNYTHLKEIDVSATFADGSHAPIDNTENPPHSPGSAWRVLDGTIMRKI